MDEIRMMEKPEWVSWNDMHELLLAAHKKNIEKGVVMQTTTMTDDDIEKYLGEDGKCFVAFCGDALVGTTSVRVSKGDRWYDKDMIVAKGTMSAILPEYQGLGLLEDMNVLRDRYIAENGVQLLEGDTPEENVLVRKLVTKKGFKEVRFFPASHQNHYSVYFVKWLGECPFTDNYIHRRFKISEKLTKWQYKPGKVERSRIISFLCKKANKLVKMYYGD